jgi:hypothetical protein
VSLAETVIEPDPTVADLLAQAGRAARGRGAQAVASAAFERAARLSPDEHERASRFIDAAESAWLAGWRTHAIALLEDAGVLGAATASGETSELRLRA